MGFNIVSVLIVVFLKTAVLEFMVVSATQRPSDLQQLSDRVGKLEEQLKLGAIDKKINEMQEQLDNVLNSENPSYSKQKFPKHCKEVQDRGYNVTTIYTIKPDLASEAFFVQCNMELRGGGWTYFHNRYDGSQNFYLNWNDYKQGFGNIAGEFWLGLDHLYQLTGNEVNELLIELVDWDLNKFYAHYNVFSIGDESEGYSLKILGEYSGDAGDSLIYQAGSKFTTKDKDQDYSSANCATLYTGAWWFTDCFNCHLNGQYFFTSVAKEHDTGLNWRPLLGQHYSLKEARMMVKPRHLTKN